MDYYTRLLGDKNHNRKHVCSNILQNGNLVTETQKGLTKEEVKQALWAAIDGNKSPDGYGSKFSRIAGK